ncbi:sialin-like [Babylonia areolata]|uniref:sialin-like n=1 Tax=Babylonia areolata TaxID=304850 RepID=UPI003FD4EA62
MAKEEEEKKEKEEKEESCLSTFTSCRWVTGYVCCAARFAQVAIRQCIGMAVVCMTLTRGGADPPEDFNNNSLAPPSGGGAAAGGGVAHDGFVGTSGQRAAVVAQSDHNETAMNAADFVWSSDFEALVLNAFNMGFFCSPIPGGHLAGRLGGKRVVLVALLVGSLLTLLLPLAASFHDYLVVLLRALAGLALGVVDPAIQSLWARWAPQSEKARLTTCSFTGVSLAGIFTFLISAHLCGVPLHGGWPFIFYFFGGFAFLCTIPWMFLIYDTPEQHPRILDSEKTLIAKGRKQDMGNKRVVGTPWGNMLRSGPFWAIVVSHATYSWVTTWMMAYLPKYLKEMMKFDVKEDGLYSSLPYVGRMLTGFVCGSLSDRLLRSGLLTTGQCRKLFQVLGCVGCAGCMLAVGFLDHTARAAAVLLLVLALSLQNLTSVAFRINHLDIAPRFAGVMMGISLTVAMAFSLTGPPVTAAIVRQGRQEEWLGVFVIVASLNIVGALVFYFFGSGEVQPWALPPKPEADLPIVSVVVMGNGDHYPPCVGTLTTKDSLDGPRNILTETKERTDETVGVLLRDPSDGQLPLTSLPKRDKTSDAEDGSCSEKEDSEADEDKGSEATGGEDEDDERGETISSRCGPTTVPATSKPSGRRALSHTMSMPVQYGVGAGAVVNKHSLLRKRVSSTDVHHHQHQQNADHHPTKGRQHNPASAKPPRRRPVPSSEPDAEDGGGSKC